MFIYISGFGNSSSTGFSQVSTDTLLRHTLLRILNFLRCCCAVAVYSYPAYAARPGGEGLGTGGTNGAKRSEWRGFPAAAD